MYTLANCLILVVLAFLCPGMAQAAPEPYLTAPAAILVEASNGQVLYEYHARQERDPASTTKIMTAILALELGQLDMPVQVTEYAASTPGTSIYLTTGETLKLGDLVKGALINSGNDAATAIAEGLAGSEATFAWLMSRKAKQLGAFYTKFQNSHGLSELGHYSCAYDLALMARYALRNPFFCRLVSTREDQIPTPDGVRFLYNTNRLLDSYHGCDGIKTGTTDAAGQCLVASATRGGRQLISVVLGSSERYSDTRNLLDYGFDNFYAETATAGEIIGQVFVKNGERNRVALAPETSIAFSVHKDQAVLLEKRVLLPPFVNAPVREGQQMGEVIILFKGQEVARSVLVAAREVTAKPWRSRSLLSIKIR